MKTLVTGGAGFIGSHLVDRLLEEGHSVTVIDNLSNRRMENLAQHKKNKNLKIVEADVSDFEKIHKYFEDIDWVFHLAALADIVPSIQEPLKYYKSNVSGTISVLEASRLNKVKKFLYASSSSIYGIPENTWFVCFHSRDPAYLSKEFGIDSKSYTIRDANIKNYLKAAEYITSQGGYAIRMGSVVSEKLPNLKNPKIIDYATKYRNDFLDIYLSAKCKFFLGCTAGLWCVSTIFNVPVAGANFFHFHTPYKK